MERDTRWPRADRGAEPECLEVLLHDGEGQLDSLLLQDKSKRELRLIGIVNESCGAFLSVERPFRHHSRINCDDFI